MIVDFVEHSNCHICDTLWSFTLDFDISDYQIPVTFLRCAAPIKNFSSLGIIQVPAICNNNNNNIVDGGASSPSPALHYSYVSGEQYLSISDVPDSCTIGTTTRVPNSSWPINHTPSFMSLHRAMEFGIELSWDSYYCL